MKKSSDATFVFSSYVKNVTFLEITYRHMTNRHMTKSEKQNDEIFHQKLLRFRKTLNYRTQDTRVVRSYYAYGSCVVKTLLM